jgi:hypothetical protein
MIEKQLPAAGAMTEGVYNTSITDITDKASPEIDIEVILPEDAMTMIELEEGGDFNANLLETVFADRREEIATLVTDLLQDYEEDLRSREDWEKTYKKGLELLGLQIEDRNKPWPGACGVFHPLITEAVVRFQSEAITETFPAQGPVKTQVLGKQTPQKLAAAERVKDDMNWRLTDQMPEYRVEHERLLWNLPIAGSAFKKVYDDPVLGRQTSVFVAADDVVVNYGATDINSAERVTHVMRRSETWLKRMIASGAYVGDDIGSPDNQVTELQGEKDKLTGTSATNSDGYTILEMLVDLTIENDENEQEYPWPYVVTINKNNSMPLAIRRNWRREDPIKRKRRHFIHYNYITGFGFYGFGLIHLVGGHARSGTSLLRQLVDSGTLSNLPGGFKTRGMRIKGEDTPIQPAEFRDVDVSSGTLRDNILPLPYKEPSGTLFQLLNTIVDDGRKAANISDVNFSDANQNAPVGTTLALIERQLKTLSAVQARIHAAMRQEFKLLKELIKNNGEREYPYEIDDDPERRTKDSDYDTVEIIPVSDPNATTMGVRIAQFQAVMQLADKDPQLYDKAFLHREMVNTLGVKNAAKIIPMPEDHKPRDPVAENMAVLMSRPVKAFLQQNHKAHMAVHQSFMNDPKIGMLLGQNPNAQTMFNAMQAHIAEHAAYEYRAQIQQALGIALPDPNEEMDPQAEYELAGLLAQAAQAVQSQNTNEQAQAQTQQQSQDPVLQMQGKELQLKEREVVIKERKQQLEEMIAAKEHSVPQQGGPDKGQLEVASALSKERRAEEEHRMKLAEKARKQAQEEQKHRIAIAAQVQKMKQQGDKRE